MSSLPPSLPPETALSITPPLWMTATILCRLRPQRAPSVGAASKEFLKKSKPPSLLKSLFHYTGKNNVKLHKSQAPVRSLLSLIKAPHLSKESGSRIIFTGENLDAETVFYGFVFGSGWFRLRGKTLLDSDRNRRIY